MSYYTITNPFKNNKIEKFDENDDVNENDDIQEQIQQKISNKISLDNVKSKVTREQFSNKQEHSNYYDTRNKDVLKFNLEQHDLAKLFFSKTNQKRIQKKIKKQIFYNTNGAFVLEEDQNDDDLLIAMRAVYFNHSEFKPNNLIHQVKELNNKVIEYILPDMITEIKQECEYLREINRPLQPIALPVNVNSTKQTLPSLSTIYE
jgi:hypothetical protein